MTGSLEIQTFKHSDDAEKYIVLENVFVHSVVI